MNENEIEGLKKIRDYFCKHDKSMFEHMAYSLLDSIIKKTPPPTVSIDFYTQENLTLQKVSQDTIRIKIKSLGEFTIPKDKLFNGIDELKNKLELH